MHKIDHPTRIRKSLTSLAGLQNNDERKGYFYCLKLLGILPPFPNSKFDNWIFPSPPSVGKSWPDQKKHYRPKCLHDVLIGSHATSCQHANLYFSFYHRHLMILTEIFLNFAHQILKGGLVKLKSAYSSPQFEWLYSGQNQILWEDVCDTYQKFKGIPEQIANHYWAPTDYQNDSDLSIPFELAVKEKSDDAIDILYWSINKCYPWEIHTPRRWYNKEDQYNKEDLPFYNTSGPILPTKQEKLLMQGKLDPRQSSQNRAIYNSRVKNPKDGQTRLFLDNFFFSTINNIFYRCYTYYNEGNKNFIMNGITPNQSLTIYGAKSKKLNYITTQEKIKYGISNEFVQNFNMSFPHYQYAYALFALGLKDFIEEIDKGLQRPHNTMHCNFGFILQDPVYSVSSFLFYPYHSWIDCMIEFKIRRATVKDVDYFQTALNDQYYKLPNRSTLKIKQVFNQISSHMAPLTDWKISGEDRIKQGSGGCYPILQWVSPTYAKDSSSPSFSLAFCTRDFVLAKDSKIRDSQNMNELYHHHNYVELHKQKYVFFEKISQFNYNYNYQIGTRPQDTNNLLNQTATNLPKYLLNMEKDVLANQAEKKKVVKNQEIDWQVQLEHRKICQNGIKVFISHPSNAENGRISIILLLKNILKDTHSKLTPQQIDDLQRYISTGLKVNDIFIVGKGESAESCHKCQEDKGVFLNLDEDIRLRIPHLWKYIHSASLNKVYYDSKKSQAKLTSIYDKLSLVPIPKFTDYRFIQGSEEIVVNVETNIETKEAKFVRLDVYSYSVRTNKLKIIVSKKHQTFQTSFDFYKLFDVDNENQRIFFDRYVYKMLRGWISVGNQRVKFTVQLPSFQRLLRLTLHIDREDNKLHVRMVDRDYDDKINYYRQLK